LHYAPKSITRGTISEGGLHRRLPLDCSFSFSTSEVSQVRQSIWVQPVTWLQPSSSESTLLTHGFQILWPSNSHSST